MSADELVQAFSFKILVHEVQLLSKENIIIQQPQVSVSLGEFPRLVIRGEHSISPAQANSAKAFSHGKSALIQMQPSKLRELLSSQPLEILLLNDSKILAGSQISLKSFADVFDIVDAGGNYRFKRGTFHLVNQLGKPYGLIDTSMCLHPNVHNPTLIKDREMFLSNLPSQFSGSGLASGFQNTHRNVSLDPPPEEITFKKKSLSYGKPSSNRNPILVEDPGKQIKHMKPLPSKGSTQRPSQGTSIFRTKIPMQPPKPPKPPKHSVKVVHHEDLPQETLPDISIMDWVNGYHCPPPMILDNKIYYHEILPEAPYYSAAGQHGMFQHTTHSIGVQTEGFVTTTLGPQTAKDIGTNPSKSIISESKSAQRQQTNQSEEYPEDFESIGQSQQFGSQIRQPSQSLSQQLSYGTHYPLVEGSPKQSIRKQKTQLTQGDLVDEEMSEIYSEDFDSMSQSQSMKRSQSLEKLQSRSYKKTSAQIEEESYIQDFESISQSYSSVQKLRRK